MVAITIIPVAPITIVPNCAKNSAPFLPIALQQMLTAMLLKEKRMMTKKIKAYAAGEVKNEKAIIKIVIRNADVAVNITYITHQAPLQKNNKIFFSIIKLIMVI